MQKKFYQRLQVFSYPAFFMVILFALVLTVGCDFTTETTRLTKQGLVQGVEEETMLAFRGIPYAAPPVGDLRFTPPQEPAKRDGILDTTEFCSTCPQTASAFGTGSVNEDCLYLNIFTPKGHGPYPVMVWIHGGAFISGSGSEAGYDPTRLVAENVIVVTLNYRLGALGFLPLPALTEEQGESGNYGLMDQQAALRWIKANIAFFKGNPCNVTIFGESAGGHSIMSHLVAPSSAGLFQRAIVESGAYSPTQLPMAYGYAYYGAGFTARAGIPAGTNAETREFLRNMTVEEVLAAQGSDWYVPVTGGAFLPRSIYEGLATGQFTKVPVLSGSNLHEGQLFVLLDMAKGKYYLDDAAYDAGVAGLVATDPRGLNAAQIADDYLALAITELGGYAAHPNRFRVGLSKLWTDYFFTCNNLVQWNQLSAKTNTFAYWFTDDAAPEAWSSAALPIDATHTLEIQYVFGLVGARGGSEAQIALSEEMVGYWTKFAKKGNPGAAWAPFTSTNGGFVKKLDTPSEDVTAADFCATHNCAYWAAPPKLQ